MNADPSHRDDYDGENRDMRGEGGGGDQQRPTDPGEADGLEPYELEDPEELTGPLRSAGTPGAPGPGSAPGLARPAPSGVNCPHCGYDLSGTPVGGACPECGTPVRAAFERRTAASTHNGLSITSMILGILSLVGCLCTGVLGPILAILAIAFGVYGRRETERQGRAANEDTMALTGLICGGIALGITAIAVLVWIISALAH